MLVSSRRLAAKVGAITFAPPTSAIDAYLDRLANKNFSPHTLRTYRGQLERVERAIARPLVQATARDLDGFLARMRRAGRKATTIRHMQATLRGFFRWARDRAGLVTVDPTKDFEPPKVEQRTPIHLDEGHVDRLFAALSASDRWAMRESAIVRCLYYTGMRSGELLGLNWADINLVEGRLRVFGKGRKERVLPVCPQLAEAFVAWQAHHPGGEAVFCSFTAPPYRLTYDTMRRIVKGAIARAGLAGQKFSPHKLRHTFATRLLDKGVRIDQIQQLLGHRSISTTMIYAHTAIGGEMAGTIGRLL
jgi:site-specific recombinase XerD